MMRAQYLDPLQVEPVGPNLWKLLHEFRFISARHPSEIIVDAGFVTDFESVPEALPTVRGLLYGYANGPAVLHDWLYRMKLWHRADADDLFLEALETEATHAPDGTLIGWPRPAWWRRRAFYAGVRAGGWVAWARDG